MAHGGRNFFLPLVKIREIPNSDPCVRSTTRHLVKGNFARYPEKISKFLFSAPGILAIGVFLRILIFNYPHSDDLYRYVWEGLVQSQGINPYTDSPEYVANKIGFESLYEGINHKDWAAIYPPLSLLTFRFIATTTSYFSNSGENLLAVFKVFFIVCDIAVIFALNYLIKSWNKPDRWLALYAWNPLVLLYGAGEKHILMFC